MNKLLTVCGLVILLVAFSCATESDEDFSDYFEPGLDSNSNENNNDNNDEIDENDKEASSEGNHDFVAKGEFVESDGKKKECDSHANCYDQREPQTWCRLNENQSWLDLACFCDSNLHSCVIERMNSGKLEYTYCASEQDWQCKDEEGNNGEINDYVAKGEFVETDGKKKECNSHSACYDQREPQAWCVLDENQSWVGKGCFCDDNLHSCVIERKNNDKLEYAYCAPAQHWQCDTN